MGLSVTSICSCALKLHATVWLVSELQCDICVLFHAPQCLRVHSKGASKSWLYITIVCVFLTGPINHLVVLFDVFLAQGQRCHLHFHTPECLMNQDLRSLATELWGCSSRLSEYYFNQLQGIGNSKHSGLRVWGDRCCHVITSILWNHSLVFICFLVCSLTQSNVLDCKWFCDSKWPTHTKCS